MKELMALGIVPGWCPCGTRTQLVLGFEGWVRVCGGCGGYARQIAAARMREEAERQHNPPSSIRIPKIISGFRRGSKDSSKKTRNLFRNPSAECAGQGEQNGDAG